MHKISIVITVAAALVATTTYANELPSGASANDQAQMAEVIKQYAASMKPGTASLCAPVAVITDVAAPYLWNGPQACEIWRKEILAELGKRGITNPRFELSPPLQFMVSGDRGYAAYTVDTVATKDNKEHHAPGNTWTLAMRKIDGVWKIASWTYTRR